MGFVGGIIIQSCLEKSTLLCAIRLPLRIGFLFTWVKIRLQKLITLFISLYDNHTKNLFPIFCSCGRKYP